MSNTLWILEEDQESDNRDHSEILERSKELDTFCSKINLPKLSSFFDESILAEEFGMEVEPKYYDASIVEELILVLTEEVRKNTNNTFLVDEMEDILSKCTLAKEKNTKVRLALVP